MIEEHVIDRIAGELAAALGTGAVTRDRDVLDTYSRDETADLVLSPQVVVRPRDTGDVRRIMEICNTAGVPVTPRGAGSGVTGGALAASGGVVLSLEKLNRILEIDRENLVAVVEPGVITGVLQKAVEAEGLMYPPDPASLDMCSIGGNVAENAGGPRAVKYGTTRDYILGLECVLADGSVITTGGKMVKNVTGYNLTGILVGSEGTLGIITKIWCRLVPAPRVVKDLLVPFPELEDAVDAVFTLVTNRVIPAVMEFMERGAIEVVSAYLGSGMPFPGAGAHLLIQLHGDSEEAVGADLGRIASLVGVPGDRILAAESARQREGIWKARRSIREAIHAADPRFFAEDCVVPRSRIAVFIRNVQELFRSRGCRGLMFGHAGDGNVHIDVMSGNRTGGEWDRFKHELRIELYRLALAEGGTITGEHGIGYLRKQYLPLALPGHEIDLLRRIKHAFDPRGILNPGKIWPDSDR